MQDDTNVHVHTEDKFPDRREEHRTEAQPETVVEVTKEPEPQPEPAAVVEVDNGDTTVTVDNTQ